MRSEFKPVKDHEFKDCADDIRQWKKDMERFISLYNQEEDPELKMHHKEDAYLYHIKMVKEGKVIGKRQFKKQGLDKVFNCPYNKLEIKEYEAFNIGEDYYE
jgi:hypothetical protein